jgi:hypothetical protein
VSADIERGVWTLELNIDDELAAGRELTAC